MVEALHSLDVTDDDLVSRRPSALLLDSAFLSRGEGNAVHVVWDGAPGDHAWIAVDLMFEQLRINRRRPSIWRCRDDAGYEHQLAATAPTYFDDINECEAYVASAMQDWADTLRDRGAPSGSHDG